MRVIPSFPAEHQQEIEGALKMTLGSWVVCLSTAIERVILRMSVEWSVFWGAVDTFLVGQLCLQVSFGLLYIY